MTVVILRESCVVSYKIYSSSQYIFDSGLLFVDMSLLKFGVLCSSGTQTANESCRHRTSCTLIRSNNVQSTVSFINQYSKLLQGNLMSCCCWQPLWTEVVTWSETCMSATMSTHICTHRLGPSSRWARSRIHSTWGCCTGSTWRCVRYAPPPAESSRAMVHIKFTCMFSSHLYVLQPLAF